MTHFSQHWLIPVVLAGWFGVADRALASHGVNDDGKFFSADAVARASQKIKDLYRDYQQDLLIDTVPLIPPALQSQYDKQGKKEFFLGWTHKRAEDVRDYFVQTHQIAKKRFTTVGYGFSRPKAPNDPVNGNPENQRIVIRIRPPLRTTP